MAFTTHNYSVPFKSLRQDVKNKAIEIANTLIQMGYAEDIAEMIAFSNARQCYSCAGNESSVSRKKMNVHLVPHPEGWALISEDATVLYFVFFSKSDALTKARIFAKNEKVKLYIHSLVGNISDTESFVVNRPTRGPEQHLVSEGKAWAVKSIGEERPAFIFETRREAVKKATWLAKKVRSSLVIHNESGDIERRLSFEV
jgi:hypothetical protein